MKNPEEKMRGFSVDPVKGFMFIHFLLSSTIAACISDRLDLAALMEAEMTLNRELVRFEQWRKQFSIQPPPDDLKAYYLKARMRFLHEIETLQKIHAAAQPAAPVEILKPEKPTNDPTNGNAA